MINGIEEAIDEIIKRNGHRRYIEREYECGGNAKLVKGAEILRHRIEQAQTITNKNTSKTIQNDLDCFIHE